MASRLRFRPVLFGPPARPTVVFYLEETPDGVIFRDTEISWPLRVSLDEAAISDLPKRYQAREVAATILPVQEATGDTRLEAGKRMMAALQAHYAGGGKITGQERSTTARRRRGAA